MKKKITKILKTLHLEVLLWILIVILTIPFLLTGYINIHRNQWETDRNFYGKECTADKIKVVKNSYKMVECQTKNITKIKKNGKLQYKYYENGDKILILSKKNYKKYVKGSDIFYAYIPTCKLSYQSKRGKLTADLEGKSYTITPHKFFPNEINAAKQMVEKECKDKIFSTYSDEDVENMYTKKETNTIVSILLDDHHFIEFKDKRGRDLTTLFTVTNNNFEGNICGKSLVKSSKYDQLFDDHWFYLPSPKLNDAKGKLFLFAAHLNMYYYDNFSLLYFLLLLIPFLLLNRIYIYLFDQCDKKFIACGMLCLLEIGIFLFARQYYIVSIIVIFVTFIWWYYLLKKISSM